MTDTARIETHRFKDDGRVPNSPLPLVVMRSALKPGADDPAAAFEKTFARNGWTNAWRNGVFPYHHYHTTSHEVLGVAKGSATVRFGGENGTDIDLDAGDVVVIPAGVGHKRQRADADFLIVGAYPDGRDYDIVRADDTDAAVHAEAVKRIAALPRPDSDPVAGEGGPLTKAWQDA